MRLGQRVIQLDSLLREGFGTAVALGWPQEVVGRQHAVGVRQSGVCDRVFRVFFNRLLEALHASLQSDFVALVPIESSLQIEVVSLKVIGIPAHERSALVRELDLQLIDNLSGDLILKLKYVLHVPIVFFRPHLVTVRNFHELCRDAKPLACLSNASFQHGVDVQLLADRGKVDVLLLEPKRRSARDDAQAFDV